MTRKCTEFSLQVRLGSDEPRDVAKALRDVAAMLESKRVTRRQMTSLQTVSVWGGNGRRIGRFRVTS